MDVRAAASAGEPDLRGPEAEPGAGADQIPEAIVASLAVQRLLEAEQVAVEVAGGLEVGDLQHQLGDAAHRRRFGHALRLPSWGSPHDGNARSPP